MNEKNKEYYIPKDIINFFYQENNEYRKYFIKKSYDYLLVDFTVLSIILSFFFNVLSNWSKLFTVLLFIFAISSKWYIITKKLKEFVIPFEMFWKEYDTIEEKANKIQNEKEKIQFIKKETEEMFFGSKYNTARDTHNYYTNLMRKLNKYISFSFFCVIIVLLNIGRAEINKIIILGDFFIISFDVLIFLLFLFSVIFVLYPFKFIKKWVLKVKKKENPEENKRI